MIERNPLNGDAGLPEGSSSIEGGSAGAVDGFNAAALRRGYSKGKLLAESGEDVADLDSVYVLPELLDRDAQAGWLDDY